MEEAQLVLTGMTYKQLQALAKVRKVRANRKKDDLVILISRALKENGELEEFLMKNEHKPQPEPATSWTNATKTVTGIREFEELLHKQYPAEDILPVLKNEDLAQLDTGYVPNGDFFVPQNTQKRRTYATRNKNNALAYYQPKVPQKLPHFQNAYPQYYNNGFDYYTVNPYGRYSYQCAQPAITPSIPKPRRQPRKTMDEYHTWADPIIKKHDPFLSNPNDEDSIPSLPREPSPVSDDFFNMGDDVFNTNNTELVDNIFA